MSRYGGATGMDANVWMASGAEFAAKAGEPHGGDTAVWLEVRDRDRAPILGVWFDTPEQAERFAEAARETAELMRGARPDAALASTEDVS